MNGAFHTCEVLLGDSRRVDRTNSLKRGIERPHESLNSLAYSGLEVALWLKSLSNAASAENNHTQLTGIKRCYDMLISSNQWKNKQIFGEFRDEARAGLYLWPKNLLRLLSSSILIAVLRAFAFEYCKKPYATENTFNHPRIMYQLFEGFHWGVADANGHGTFTEGMFVLRQHYVTLWFMARSIIRKCSHSELVRRLPPVIGYIERESGRNVVDCLAYQTLQAAQIEDQTVRDAELIRIMTIKPFRWILHEDNFPTKEVAALFTEATDSSIENYTVVEIPWGPPGRPGKRYLV